MVPKFRKGVPPTDDIPKFYNIVLPFFERANANVRLSLNEKDQQIIKSKAKKISPMKEKKEVCHHNDGKQNVVLLEGKPFKCNGVKVRGKQ